MSASGTADKSAANPLSISTRSMRCHWGTITGHFLGLNLSFPPRRTWQKIRDDSTLMVRKQRLPAERRRRLHKTPTRSKAVSKTAPPDRCTTEPAGTTRSPAPRPNKTPSMRHSTPPTPTGTPTLATTPSTTSIYWDFIASVLVALGCCVIFGQRIDGFSYAARAGCW